MPLLVQSHREAERGCRLGRHSVERLKLQRQMGEEGRECRVPGTAQVPSSVATVPWQHLHTWNLLQGGVTK